MSGRLLALLACLVACAEPALACGPPPPLIVEFNGNSTTVTSVVSSALKPAIDQLRRFGPKCSSFYILVQTGDDTAPSRRIANARAAEIEKVLVKAGAGATTIEISLQVGSAPQRVQVSHYGALGRTYCDPTSKNPAYVDGANCQERYTRCYVQLEDGTVCNYDNVPNPNPAQYSVIQ